MQISEVQLIELNVLSKRPDQNNTKMLVTPYVYAMYILVHGKIARGKKGKKEKKTVPCPITHKRRGRRRKKDGKFFSISQNTK